MLSVEELPSGFAVFLEDSGAASYKITMVGFSKVSDSEGLNFFGFLT